MTISQKSITPLRCVISYMFLIGSNLKSSTHSACMRMWHMAFNDVKKRIEKKKSWKSEKHVWNVLLPNAASNFQKWVCLFELSSGIIVFFGGSSSLLGYVYIVDSDRNDFESNFPSHSHGKSSLCSIIHPSWPNIDGRVVGNNGTDIIGMRHQVCWILICSDVGAESKHIFVYNVNKLRFYQV